jgi:pantetheine-phosphate adenylyltransferase
MRVVAGVAGGRRLQAPPGRRTRPTADRVREALFSSLESLSAVRGATVVDLFAGTGALGIEALSRGAASAVFVDADPAAVRTIRANLAATGLAGTVVHADVFRFLEEAPAAMFDLALVDPPYAFTGWPELLRRLPAGLVAIESGFEVDPGLGWQTLRSRRYGGTVVTLARRAAAPREGGKLVGTALIPGSFDPVTYGHLDIIERVATLFDEVVVAAVGNPAKAPVFSLEERKSMLADVTAHLPNLRIESFDGLLVDFALARGVKAVVKGLRAVSDFDYELQMAQMNYRLSGVETLFMPTTPEHSFLSSSLVREVAGYGGEVSSMVPPAVAKRLEERFK